MISLYAKILLFHCYSRPALKLGRRFLDEEFAGRLEFDYEDTLELTDLAKWLEEHRAGTFAGFLDKPHFFLDDRTPREASRSEQDRPQLVELMKVALYEIDQRNRRFELALSIDAILRELGLAELVEGC
jgi:hypothetical protein